MAKRKTFKTMQADERIAVRREMLKEAESLLRHNFPEMTDGAVRVKAYKFVEDSIAKEMQRGKVNSSSTKGDSSLKVCAPRRPLPN